MIIFFEHGRLGNQLFQYAALKTFFPKENVVLFGFEDLDEIIEPVDAKLIKRSDLPRWLPFGLARRFFSFLAGVYLIGSVWEKRNPAAYELESSRGLIFGVKLLQSSFFQHSTLTKRLKPDFEVREHHKQKARTWISRNLAGQNQENFVFVHIRRGDYLHWPSRDNPAVLDLKWYLRAMDRIKAKIKHPQFIIITDDVFYARDVFSSRDDLVISESSPYVDFALMGECPHGILSASSFAWWGAWFSRQKHQDQSIYLAPKYWSGHRANRWFPEGFISDWITYIE